jgi:hypothetical protein
MTCGGLYLYDTIFEGFVQDFENMVLARRELVHKRDAVVRHKDLSRPRHLPSTD